MTFGILHKEKRNFKKYFFVGITTLKISACFSTAVLQKMSDFSLTLANNPQNSLVFKFKVNCDGNVKLTAQNLTLKCNAYTSVKVDAQIEEECRRTISYLQGYSCPKLYCKKLSNQKPILRIQFAIQEEQLYSECELPFIKVNLYLSLSFRNQS